jgi:hypothetical protein
MRSQVHVHLDCRGKENDILVMRLVMQLGILLREKKGVENDGKVALDPITLATDDQLCEMDRLRTNAAVTSTIFSCVSIDNIHANSKGLDVGSSDDIEQGRKFCILKKKDIQSCN